jgi:hypothetical protein
MPEEANKPLPSKSAPSNDLVELLTKSHEFDLESNSKTR